MTLDIYLLTLFPITRLIIIWLNKPFFKQGFVGDSSVHFSIFKHVKISKSRYISQYLISPKPMCYPILFHRTFQFINLKLIEKKSFLPNLILFSIFLPLACIIIFKHEKLIYSEVYLILLLLFDFNLWFVERKNIAYLKLSERLMGRLSTSFVFLFLYYFLETPSIFYFLAAIIFGVVSILSSVFARQVIIFIIPFLATVYGSILCALYIPIILFFAYLFEGKYFIDGIFNTFKQWKIYKTQTKKSKTVRANLSQFFSYTKLKYYKSFRKKIKYLLKSEPFSLIFYPNIFFILFTDEINLKFIAPFILIYLVTSTNRFNHLGESIRYLEYGLTFIIPILLMNQGLVQIQIAILINLIMVILYFIFKLNSQKENNDRLGLFLKNSKIEDNSIIFPVSMRTGADLCARGNFKSFWWQPGIISNEIYDDYVLEYPYLRPELIELYKVDYILVDLIEDQKKDWKYDFKKYKLIKSDEKYKLYKI